MTRLLGVFGLRFPTGPLIWAAVLIPACIALFLPPRQLWIGITLAIVSRWPQR